MMRVLVALVFLAALLAACSPVEFATETPAPTVTPPIAIGAPSYIKETVAYKEGYKAFVIYFILADAGGQMIASDGRATITIRQTGSSYLLYDAVFQVKAADFIRTTVGQGGLAHEALLWSLGRLPYDRFQVTPTGSSGSLSVTFTAPGGEKLTGKDDLYFDN